MITRFNLFEEITYDFNRTNRPKVGDYVLIKYDNRNNHRYSSKIYRNFIESNVGKIISKSQIFIRVRYENIPDKIKDWFTKTNFTSFTYDDVIAYSDNKKELKTILKYNL